MSKNLIISLDSQCCKNPGIANIDPKLLQNHRIEIISDGDKFRQYINDFNDKAEIIVVSNNDIDPINLAATAKHDRSDCVVNLVANHYSGSLKSRADAAHIDSIIGFQSFRDKLLALYNIDKNISNVSKNFPEIKNSDKITNNTNKTFVLSVLSSSGGSGKSCVSTMISVLLQSAGVNTLLIDADLQFGDCGSLLGIDNSTSIEKLLLSYPQIPNLKTKTNMPSFLSAPDKPELNESIAEKLPFLINNIKNNFDAIVINTGAYWNELQALLLENDSKSIFLIDQRASSINSSKKVIDLCSRCGIATGSLNFVLNRCSKHSLFSSIDVSYALKGLAVHELLDGGLDVDECMSSGNPLKLIKNNNPFPVSLWALVEKILPKDIMQDIVNNSKFESKDRPSVKNKSVGFFRRRRA